MAAIGYPAEALKISNSTVHEARKNSIADNSAIDPNARVNRKHSGSYPGNYRYSARLPLRLQPDLHELAEGPRAGWRIVLPRGPCVDHSDELVGKAHRTHRVFPGRWTACAGAFATVSFRCCLFHDWAIQHSSLKNKRSPGALERSETANPKQGSGPCPRLPRVIARHP